MMRQCQEFLSTAKDAMRLVGGALEALQVVDGFGGAGAELD